MLQVYADHVKDHFDYYQIAHHLVIVVVDDSPDYSDPKGFWVCMENVAYPCADMLSALKLSFKTYHVLGIAYPMESAHIFQLIQKPFISLPERMTNLILTHQTWRLMS